MLVHNISEKKKTVAEGFGEDIRTT